ncbi:citrate:proton symporter [Caulobacter sp. NIBR1757]|uniref:CitMHS family transporter n=1 Tax=Caulobacter sp. NIBR1757 TaxID=3016000 RepID=UPI0022F1196D|nr:citrate:proton symporter [Caulobacter sp. NIBR1757]WGM37960.1 Citrate transporter [Caulobacter sp. NIBR1757]
MTLALLGFAMIAVFMTLVMTRRMTAVVALIIVPIVFALFAGAGPGVGAMMLKGLAQTAPTAIMLMFAILYFGVMIDAGLFQPLVRRIVAWAGENPVKLMLGHVALVAIVGLDGDGTTTILVAVSALLPVYRKLGIDILKFAVLGSLTFILMNMSPWGGPAARVAASLKIDPSELFIPMLPVVGAGLASVFALAWWFGRQERARLAKAPVAVPADDAPDISDSALAGAFRSDPAALRPGLIWLNFSLTAVLMVAVVLRLAPLPALFMAGAALALAINYPRLADQRDRLISHAGNVLSVGVMVLAAGAFTGVMTETGMIKAMADSILTVLPPEVGPFLAPITALISIPANFLLSADAWYFGVLPVIAETAAPYGVTPEQIGRASLMGGPVHSLSPLVAAVYLKCALLDIELADLQRYAWKYALGLCGVLIAAALLFGVIPLVAAYP